MNQSAGAKSCCYFSVVLHKYISVERQVSMYRSSQFFLYGSNLHLYEYQKDRSSGGAAERVRT